MFKLTYQAYILLSISSSYYIYKLINEKNKIYKILAILACLILAINSTYIERYLSKDFGNIFNYDEYKGIDGTKYLIRRAPNEYEAITFINDNFKDRHKFLEASTDSYSEGNKISSFTGNITIYGWKTHESLWNNYQEKDERNLAIAKIYTSGDKKEIIKELKKYKIEYIVIGPTERTVYKDINDRLLESLGYKIFENNSVKIIKLNI